MGERVADRPDRGCGPVVSIWASETYSDPVAHYVEDWTGRPVTVACGRVFYIVRWWARRSRLGDDVTVCGDCEQASTRATGGE